MAEKEKRFTTDNRDFKGVWMPKEIYLNEDLYWTEKILLVEIDSLDNNEEKGCYASNKYFSEFLGIKESTTANLISKLKKKGYIYQVFFDGRNRGLRLTSDNQPSFKNESRLHLKVKADSILKLEQTSFKNEHNNIYNNTINNTDNKNTSVSDETVESLKEIDYINTTKTGDLEVVLKKDSILKESISVLEDKGCEPKVVKDVGAIPGKQIASIINMFKDINPLNYDKWFSISAHRNAIANVIKKIGFEETQKMLEYCLANQTQFIPITTPLEFERNAFKLGSSKGNDKTLIGVKF